MTIRAHWQILSQETKVGSFGVHRNPSERGAAIFVVVMVITLLTGIGVYAAHSASMVDTATGYARQSSQAQGLSIYASLLAASELDQGRTAAILLQMDRRTEICPSNPTGAPNLPCYKILDAEMSNRVKSHPGNDDVDLLVHQEAEIDGSLGPRHGLAGDSGIEGTMMVEFLEDYQSIPPAGEDKGGLGHYKTYEITLNAWSQVRPVLGSTDPSWCGTDDSSAGATLQAVRAYIQVPGIP
jgi:hypothetical protein